MNSPSHMSSDCGWVYLYSWYSRSLSKSAAPFPHYLFCPIFFCCIISSNHSMVCVKIDVKLKESLDVSFHQTIFWYSKANWDSVISFIVKAPSSIFFNNRAFRIASFISEWILSSIEIWSFSRSITQPWYIPECALTIAHHNHYFYLFIEDSVVRLMLHSEMYSTISKDFWRILSGIDSSLS